MRWEPDTILVVEDDEASRRLVRAILHYRGFRIREAEDKEHARQLLAELIPGLILMDIRLQGPDGIELTRELRSNPQFARVPIIALTAQALKGDEERIMEAGFNMYLPKPVNTRQLRKVVEQYMQLSHRRVE